MWCGRQARLEDGEDVSCSYHVTFFQKTLTRWGQRFLKKGRDDMDIRAWYSRTAIDMIFGSKVVPVVYYNLVIRR
jgi:hypothetical protein